ncbi:bifunctional UDP-N-acetylmuramoyl-tripeptide:D-alanyl-D-alanine ligase/alanine racemase [Pleomorphovibrio marinus]|uniref:bifunctional UDP-N-acetylmuramoyl-tripeptide:D-alanyl-D-alanine ligase/alanine racemase n=1 Tax=Pleomorphovibrio marinus TaxID=2164132 RepID=UPI000E0C244E|nr:bifunctional UDP-N-acetylmuramoyl-tripeptide:D-alanyl-D-alanine ligase/alanine racemase [Pleomorphovibrio marinus]
MYPFTLDTLFSLLSGEWIMKGEPTAIQSVFVDSRNIIQGRGSLFISLMGNRRDGHDFMEAAYKKGVRNFIVQNPEKVKALQASLSGSNIVMVKSSLEALQTIAKWNREKFEGITIGITGSNGKTILKEWLGQILSNDYRVAKSPKSYNSQIGVPLSLFGLGKNYQIGIIEAGISQPGEMQKLEQMIHPDIAIFTNLGSAHDSNFENRKHKLKEKAKFLKNAKYVVYCADQPLVSRFLKSEIPEDRLIGWSNSGPADYVLSTKKRQGTCKILLMKPDLGIFTFSTEFTDEASLENLRHVVATCLTLGISPAKIQGYLPQLKPVDMRLTLKQGINHCLLIDDTYNNDLAGLEIALQMMEEQPLDINRTLILSDLLQTGDEGHAYQKVADLIHHYKIKKLIGIGDSLSRYRDIFGIYGEFYPSTSEFLADFKAENFNRELILVKGARKYSFESIVKQLEEKIHGTVLEINLNALTSNFQLYRSLLPEGTRLMVMVKASAYGGGSTEIAKQLQVLGAEYLAVAYTDEGVELRKAGISLPIMVLNSNKENFEQLARHKLEPVVYSINILKSISTFASSIPTSIRIHLDIDTGMKRLGFEEKELDSLCALLKESPLLQVASIFTHLAAADDIAKDPFTSLQLKKFVDYADTLCSVLENKPLLHVLNTAGIQRFPKYAMDMVRLGIGLYGVDPVGGEALPLTQIGTLKTPIAQIKTILPEESVGYGQKGRLINGGKIATLNIGYADGFDRRFGNGVGFVLIHGQKAPVVGNVCMDMCMVDVTHIPSVKEGDEACIYGEGVELSELAKTIGTIPYELLTNITHRVKRVYFWD